MIPLKNLLLPAAAALAIALSACAILSTAQSASAVYVSPSGDDSAPGTQDRPVRSLEKARDLARGMIPGAAGDVTVYLSGGVYRLAKPLELDVRDSGANGHDVVYAAVPGQEPILSGAVAVSGWRLVDPSRNLWAARAPEALAATRQLYVNEVRAGRARGRLPVAVKENAEGTGYVASAPVLAGWRNPGDIEFVYTGGNPLWSEPEVGLGAWTEPRCPVASIQGTEIIMAQPCWDNSTKRVMMPKESGFKRTANLVGPARVGRQPAYVENAYELLGTPGQWYFDRAERTIYYVPREGEDLAKADVEAPILEQLVVGSGSEDRPVSNIVFRGLEFAFATWLVPASPEGFSEIQANYRVTGPRGYAIQALGSLVPGGTVPYGAWTKTPGNVSFSFDRKIRFIRDAFVHLGAAGLDLGDGSQEDAVEGCVFTDISANGLELGGVDLPMASAAQLTRDNRIVDNHITDIGAEYHGAIAICVGYAQRSLIAHNQIDRVPYAGISMGWGGWPDKVHRAGVANESRENVVSDNLIFDHMLLLADGGGIYTQGLTGPDLASGEKVVGNVVRDQFGTGHAIYTDNGSCNITVSGNVMFHTNHDNWGSRHGDYYDGKDGSSYDPLAILGNYWQQGGPDRAEKNVVEKGNRIIASLDDAPAAIVSAAGLEPEYRDLLERRFSEPSAPAAPGRVAAVAGDGFAYVAWSPPCFEGGAPIESYLVTSSQGARATISEPDFRAAGCVAVTGLSNGTPCTFTVRAVNSRGTGEPSLPSRPVTPSAGTIDPPSAPAAVKVYVDGGRASIHFRAPPSDGGSPIVSYVVTVNPTGERVVFKGRAVLVLSGAHETFGVVGGLRSGQTYTISIAAVNAAGVGAAAESGPFTTQ